MLVFYLFIFIIINTRIKSQAVTKSFFSPLNATYLHSGQEVISFTDTAFIHHQNGFEIKTNRNVIKFWAFSLDLRGFLKVWHLVIMDILS